MRSLTSLTALLALSALVGACDTAPTTPPAAAAVDVEQSRSTTAAMNANSPFLTWHQGFNHGTEGWYGAETPGELGWCGSVTAVSGRSGDVQPSAGRGYATVSQTGCNAHWAGVYGADLVGAPWSPGPGFTALGRPFPDGGYVMELDVYLDPAYEAVPPAAGTWVFEFPSWLGAVVGYSVSFMTLDDGALHYLWIPVWEDDAGLLVDTHPVTEAGWYTFRVVFRDEGGSLAADFELADRRGGTLFSTPVESTFYTGTAVADFDPANVGTGYTWFSSISHGLELPIDEYRVRQGG